MPYELRRWMPAHKAARDLGWTPAMDLASTLGDTVQWYLDHPEWLAAANAKIAEAAC